MSQTKCLFAAAIALIFVSAAHSEPLLVDSFESGDMSATNNHGFDWGRNNSTSVVTAEGVVYSNGERDVAIPSGRDWEPKHGEHSLRFRYAAGRNQTEQRFDLGSAYQSIWLKYWLRVPINYTHNTSMPSNNKFFAIWMDGYSKHGDGSTVFWNLLSNQEGGSNIAVSYSDGGYTIAGGQMQSTPFIKVPEDRGRWMEIAIHVKASSPTETGNIELWRRWENEANFKQFHSVEDARLKMPSQGPNGWSKGYIMGWANAPYKVDTEWLLDGFTLSTDPLLTAAKTANKPNPPTLTLSE